MEGPLDPEEATLLWRHSERLSSFHFIIPTGQAPPFRLFHGMEPPESLPSLRVFSMYGRYADCAWPAIRRLLRATPNLVELNLGGIPLVDSTHGSSTDNLRLPNLRRISFRCPTADLMRVSAQLEYLSVSTENISIDEFRSLLEQSPGLKRLRVEESTWSTGELRRMPLSQLMSFIPALAHLDIWSFEHETAEVLFTLLAESTPGSSRILPQLQSLEIRPLNAQPSASSLEVLLTALCGRRDSLRTVRIEMSDTVTLPRFVVSPDTLASMRQLVAEGMDIYIGLFLGKQNFLSVS
ncbi:hypothetical protein FB45DRAFT_1017321 [Roridomyces roridus]|uniref:F-box protein n=1 Tax=Roridomyces roridus TaxID=1738132 RepID=A0AAD7CID4_9AGAR|nr:hypothetical protein FB45DRAFT_1017321 [Roridomyces roridus]